ncbi:hypothetical protein MTO96_042498 [Rhipicephalus appendiculatus]
MRTRSRARSARPTPGCALTSRPSESSRRRRVQFRDPIRAVFFFTPDGEEESGPGGRGDAKTEDSLARSGAVRRLVTAAAVERRSSLTSEDEPPSAVMMTAAGAEGSDDDVDEDADDDFQQRVAQANDSGDDVDSFESDDNASVSEDVSELSLEGKDDNQDASVQEVSGAADVDDDRRSPDVASTASASSDSLEQRLAQKPRNSWDSSLEEETVSTVQEGRTIVDLSAEGDDDIVEEAAVTASDSPNRTQSSEVTSPPPPATSVDASTPQDDGKQLQVATSGPLEKEPSIPKTPVPLERPSTSPATLTAIYGGSSRPKSVGTAGRTSGGTIGGASTPTRARRGSSGSVSNGADQRTRSSWNRAAQLTSLQFSVPNARSVPSAKSTAMSTESGKRQQPPTRCSTAKQVNTNSRP